MTENEQTQQKKPRKTPERRTTILAPRVIASYAGDHAAILEDIKSGKIDRAGAENIAKYLRDIDSDRSKKLADAIDEVIDAGAPVRTNGEVRTWPSKGSTQFKFQHPSLRRDWIYSYEHVGDGSFIVKPVRPMKAVGDGSFVSEPAPE